MEPSSLPGHFRNRYTLRRDWHIAPVSGTIGKPISPVFLAAGRSRFIAPAIAKRTKVGATLGAKEMAILIMRAFHEIRGWRQVGLFCLLCLSVAAFAQTGTPASTAPSTQTSKPKAAHSANSHAPKHSTSHGSTQTAKASTSHGKAGAKKKTAKNSRTAKKKGQQAIDSDRARAIQEALIREHYMNGEPSGTWDAATQAAMQRYQADQGWQAKTIPDSRALIKLGLGPSKDHLLNPESAMTSGDSKSATKQNSQDPAASSPSPADRPQN